MAYDPGAIDAALAAAVGDDPALIAELRLAFIESAERAFAMLAAARTDGAWRDAAWRLKGLSASFGAVRLMALAEAAAAAPMGSEDAIRRLRRAIGRL